MSRQDCRPTELTFFERVVEDLDAFVAAQDVLWVTGGSTANLLAVWRLHGLDTLLAAAYDRGAVLCGVSAGMNCWFEGSTTDSFGPALRCLPDGLGPKAAATRAPGSPLPRTSSSCTAGRNGRSQQRCFCGNGALADAAHLRGEQLNSAAGALTGAG